MNQQWQPPSRPSGGAMGSVRRARERAEAGLPSKIPAPPRQGPYEQPRAVPTQPVNRLRPQMPQALAGTMSGQGPIGVAISRPTQVPQWPLAAKIEGTIDRTNQQYQPPAGRGAAPQRPPRPSHVPSMLDASRLQDHTPSFQYKPQTASSQGQGKDEITSPDATSPIISMSSRQSTISSVGTIPDFPVPMPPPASVTPVGTGGPARRSANLGPPPTSRRGNSSYYSNASYVSPIPEESPRTVPSHESYASSAAIPTAWGSDSPGFRFDDESDYEDDYRDSRHFKNEVIHERGESRESNFDDGDEKGLIRSASLGKRAKPSMVTTRSSEKVEPVQSRPAPLPQQPSKLERMGVLASVGASAAMTASKTRDGQRETAWPMLGDPDSPLANGTGLIDGSTSSEESVPQVRIQSPGVARAITTDEAAPSYAADPKANSRLAAYDAGGGLSPGGVTPTRAQSPAFSRLSAVRRPPRLDMDAVRDAEARGSMTSLPDLIRRATRLAAMMDRGKRPGSRLNGLNDFDDDYPSEKEKELTLSPDSGEKRQSGLSGMLSAFPPPGLGTPTRGDTPTRARPVSEWPVVNDIAQQQKEAPKRRRCCGLPIWGFLLVFLILLIIIAAAVVVPLELLVFHRPKSTTPTSSPATVESCSRSSTTTCLNGGQSVIDNGSCACICTNGFTGPTCTVANFTGCTTTVFTGSGFDNVTLGEAIPRLISGAQSNFSIPLFESVILARFSTANLTCASENALVTFDGQSVRQGKAADEVNPSAATSTASSSVARATSGSNTKARRHESQSSSAAAATQTYDSSAIYTTDSTPAATSSAAASQVSANPSGQFIITEQVLDFARVAVLFVLQQEEIDAAVTAQGAIQHVFSLDDLSNKGASNLSIGNDNTINLLSFSINLGNGSVGWAASNMTKRETGSRSSNLFAVL